MRTESGWARLVATRDGDDHGRLDLSKANPVTALVLMALGSFSFVGIGMIGAILPLLMSSAGRG